MKTKKLEKKLVLNKETLARLDNGAMNVPKAGGNPWLENQTEPISQCPSPAC
jgi:hypothetical protein